MPWSARARAGEADPGVGRVQARVQPADQQAHAGGDRVGQGPGPQRPDGEPRVRVVLARRHLLDREPGPHHQVGQRPRLPPGEAAAGEVVAGSRGVRPLAPEHGQVEHAPDRQDPVQAPEHPGQVAPLDVLEALAGPHAAERSGPHRQRPEVAGDPGRPREPAPGLGHHRRRGVGRHHRRPQVRQVVARAGPQVEPDGARRHLGRERRGPLRVGRPAPGRVLGGRALVDVDGRPVHPRRRYRPRGRPASGLSQSQTPSGNTCSRRARSASVGAQSP